MKRKLAIREAEKSWKKMITVEEALAKNETTNIVGVALDKYKSIIQLGLILRIENLFGVYDDKTLDKCLEIVKSM